MEQTTRMQAPAVPASAAAAPGNSAPLPQRQIDWAPLALVPALALAALPLIGSGSTWVTLTAAGLAMGMIIFIIASGLTLVFGLMDVLNFGHGVFIALGAFVATSVMGSMGDYTSSGSLWVNLMAVLPAMVVAMLIIPGATAYLLTDRFGRMLLIAPATSAACGVVGLYVSYYQDTSPGGMVVLTQGVLFTLVYLFGPRHGLVATRWQARRRRALLSG